MRNRGDGQGSSAWERQDPAGPALIHPGSRGIGEQLPRGCDRQHPGGSTPRSNPRVCAFAPVGTEALFEGIVAASTGFVLADGSPPLPAGVDGFGRSLLHAAQALFDHGYGSVCLLNADSPNLPTAFLTARPRYWLKPETGSCWGRPGMAAIT